MPSAIHVHCHHIGAGQILFNPCGHAGQKQSTQREDFLAWTVSFSPAPGRISSTTTSVDARFQGHGIGRLLLRAMLELALDLRDRAGCIGVVVDAKPEAAAFYFWLGCEGMELISGALGDRPEPVAMFLPIRQIEAAARR
jgi:GNAT superfamily N-acetyltransferase